MSELKPCAHCGSTYTQARYMGLPGDSGFEQGWRGECCDCGALTRAFMTKQEAVDAWNTRHVETCEWLLEHIGMLYDKWRCSKCGYLYVESVSDGGATDFDPNFCPSCGRKVER